MKINASLFVISMAVVGCSVPPEPPSKRVDTAPDAAPRPLPASAAAAPNPVPYVLRADPRLARVQYSTVSALSVVAHLVRQS
jgi:hypothetical protein